jgi:O-antigen/teichoic acid export membrane protein
MIAIYNATDKFMLKQMISENEVSYYARANSLTNMWCFVLTAIITSVTPNIINHFKNKSPQYEKRNRQLYAVIFYVSVAVAIVLTLASNWIIGFLYEPEFMPSAKPLKVLPWLTAFSYLGVARNVWVVCEGKQNYLKWLYLIAAVGNVGLNFIFIPMWGATGAAFASVITQILTAIIIPLFIKPLRPNARLMLEGIILKDVFPSRKKKKEDTNDAD